MKTTAQNDAAKREAEALSEKLTLTTEDLAEAERKARAWMREWEASKKKSEASLLEDETLQ